MTTTETTKKRERRDRVVLALVAVSRLSVEELADFAKQLKQNTPRLAKTLVDELAAPSSGTAVS